MNFYVKIIKKAEDALLYKIAYQLFINNNNETIIDNGIVKLSLPFGDANSTPETIADIIIAIPIALIPIDWENRKALQIINVDRKNTEVPIRVFPDFMILDLKVLPKQQASGSLIAKTTIGKIKNMLFCNHKDI